MSRTILMLTLLGLASSQTARAQDALVQQGQQVYAARKCSMCHSVAGKGNSKGSLDGAGAKWKADEIRQWIVNWKEMAAKHQATRKPPMTDFSKLPKGDVDALVAYIQTLK
ncbi:MAG: cytochrome c [Vicinamibacterales bacterium]|nr:cytochrome c [Vicinamibacterales bacterium]